MSFLRLITHTEGLPCRDHDPDLSFPEDDDPEKDFRLELAKSVCQGCKIIVACLDFALETEAEYGVFGGTTPEERRAMMPEALAA